MADADGRSYASPAVESVNTLTPTFLGFSGAAEAAGRLSWSLNPEGDALSAYAVVCRSSAGNAKATGTIAAATLPADELSHTLTLSVKGVAQGVSNSCVLSLTDASGLTFSDAPKTLLTSSVNVPTSVTSNGLFAAIGGSCGGAKGTTCSGSGDDVAGAVVLGRFQFQIRARHRGTILFRLTAAGHRLVAHHHRLATTLIVTVKIHGRKVTSRTPLTIAYKA
jgi:hypothetical protein